MKEEGGITFPSKHDQERVDDYVYFDKLFHGKHFDAFKIKLETDITERYGKIRYVVTNFAGLVSKVIADILFGEEISISVDKGGDQAYVDALIEENQLHTQNFESALANSRRGDALYRIRIGKRNEADPDDKPTIIIEDINPMYYFPVLDQMNVRATPKAEILAYLFDKGDKCYLHQEIHTPGKITNKVFEYNKEKRKIIAEMTNVKDFGYEPIQLTKIKRNLLFHVPNFKDGSSYFGLSDYHDLTTLLFALNNRVSKIDNILDKHSDPILAVPEGVMDEDGNVRREAFGMIEMGPDGDGKPEYIVWDANLEAAFKEIDKLVEFLLMTSETSPDALGMGEGKSDSGRALKLRMLRTLAKAKRKQIYYDRALKDLLFTAQQLGKAHGIAVGDHKLKGEPAKVLIDWPDGVINDTKEMVEEEQMRLDAGLTTKADSLMRLDGLSKEDAEKKVQEIDKEQGANLPLEGKGVDPAKLTNPKALAAPAPTNPPKRTAPEPVR